MDVLRSSSAPGAPPRAPAAPTGSGRAARHRSPGGPPGPARHGPAGPTRLALALVVGLALLGSCGEAPPPPNVVLIVLDTLRTDHMSAYGYPWETTPRLDALARRGVLFEDCTAQSSWTMPSMISLMTGLPIFRSIYKVPDEVPMLAEVFRQAGYRTGGYVANSVLAEEAGFARGLADFDARLKNTRHWTAHDVTSRGLEFLEQDDPQPFFLWLHYLDPHNPYTPPEVPWTRELDEVFLPFERETIQAGLAAAPEAERPHLALQERVLAREVDRYDGELRYMDRSIGEVLDTLAARGLTEDTYVIVAADHGETLFRRTQHPDRTATLRRWRSERNLPMQLEDFVKKEHDTYVYEELVRTPLIIAGPHIEGPRRSDALVSNLDLFPTLMGLCGLSRSGLAGRDLSGPLREGRPVPDATFVTSASDAMMAAKLPGGRKLIVPYPNQRERFGFDIEWFDLESDPHEIAPEPLDDEARALLDRLRTARERDPFARWSGEAMDAETIERLKELGYIR